MADLTSDETRRNLQVDFSYNENSSSPISRAHSTHVRRDLYRSDGNDAELQHVRPGFGDLPTRSSEGLTSARDVMNANPPSKDSATMQHHGRANPASILGLPHIRVALPRASRIVPAQAPPPRTEKTWAQVIAKNEDESSDGGVILSERGKPNDDPVVLKRRRVTPSVRFDEAPSTQSVYTHVQTQLRADDEDLGDSPEPPPSFSTAQPVHTDHSSFGQAVAPTAFNTAVVSNAKKGKASHKRSAASVQLDGAVADLIERQRLLQNSTKSSSKMHAYHIYDLHSAAQFVGPRGPMTLDKLVHERLRTNAPVNFRIGDLHTSYFICPVISPDTQSLSWLSVSHTVSSTDYKGQAQVRALQELYRRHNSKPHSKLYPQEITLNEAKAKDGTNDFLSLSAPLRPSKLIPVMLDSVASREMSPQARPSAVASNVQQLSYVPGPKGYKTLGDFIKMTPSEKRAFYSSAAMNQIKARSSTPPPPSSTPKSQYVRVKLGPSFDQEPLSEEEDKILKPRRYAANTLQAFKDFCFTNVRYSGIFYALDIRVLSDGDESPTEPDFADAEMMQKKLREYEFVMKHVPAWIEEIHVEALVPNWFNEKEMRRSLKRMEMVALGSGRGAKWSLQLEGRGTFWPEYAF